MKKILILSVGGSYEPIVNAINFYKPDFVYFFCSSGHKRSAITIVDGPGESCGNKINQSIVTGDGCIRSIIR